MMRFCQFKNLLGETRTGAHAIRILDFALVDILLTFLGAILISKWLKIEYVKALVGFFVLGIFLHWLFCVPTKLNTLLGLI